MPGETAKNTLTDLEQVGQQADSDVRDALSKKNTWIAARPSPTTPASDVDRKPIRIQHSLGKWPAECTEVVRRYLECYGRKTSEQSDQRATLKAVITQLVALTGHSRERCWRFARRLGANGKQAYREWTKSDQQRLLDLISRNPAWEVAKIMRRSPGSIRAMLHRLGASAQMGRDWFTIYTLAEALHTRSTEIQSWIDRGWLKTRFIETGRLRREIIEADAFSEFCKQHGNAVVGRRLRADRLEFVRTFVFPPSHTDLLPVRDSKKERTAFASLGSSSPKKTDSEDATEGVDDDFPE